MSQTRFIYLIHFDQPFKHAKHYLGSAFNLEDRLHDHRVGGSKCARIMHAVNKAGIGWKVSRFWRGGRADERRLKNRGGATRLCPICTPGTTAGGFVRAYRPRKPVENAQSEALSYGVRCDRCGEWATACRCEPTHITAPTSQEEHAA